MTNSIDIGDIDPYHPRLIKSQAIALCMVRDKHEQYVAKGMLDKAHGVKVSLRIMWQAFMEHKDIDTGWGEL